mgnify:CR=1 FL=1
MKKLCLALALLLALSSLLPLAACAEEVISGGEPNILAVGQTVSVPDLLDFTVDKIEWENAIRTIKGSSFYTFDSQQEMQLLYISCTLVNNSMSDIFFDKYVTAKVRFRDNYEYDGQPVQYSPDRGDRYYGAQAIRPLVIGFPRFVFTVPAQIETSTDSLVLEFTINGDPYELVIR